MELKDEKTKDLKGQPIDLWFDIPEKERESLLAAARKHLAKGGADTARKLARIEAQEKKNKEPAKRLNFASVEAFVQNFTMDEDFTFDDGWFRLIVQTRNGGLEVFNGERYETAELPNFTKVGKEIQRLVKWPGRKQKKTPWRNPWFQRVGIVLIHWDEEKKQYKAEFDGLTFWFPENFQSSSLGAEWFKVRHHSLHVPWIDTSIKAPEFRKPYLFNVSERAKEVLRMAAAIEDQNDRADLVFQVRLYLRRQNPQIPPRVILEEVDSYMKAMTPSPFK